MKANEEKRKKSTNNPTMQTTIEHSIARCHAYPKESTKRSDDVLIQLIATDLRASVYC